VSAAPSYVAYEIFCQNDENFSDEETIKEGCLMLDALPDFEFHEKKIFLKLVYQDLLLAK
jgi:hypothetical protein